MKIDLDAALKETKTLFKEYMRIKSDKRLEKFVPIEKDDRCDAIDIFAFDYFSYKYIRIAEEILKKYHVQHLAEDIGITAIALPDKHTKIRIRVSLSIRHS